MTQKSTLRKFRAEIKLDTYNINYYYDSKKALVKDIESLRLKHNVVNGYVLLDGRYNRF